MASAKDPSSKLTSMRFTREEYKTVLLAKHKMEAEVVENMTFAKLLTFLAERYLNE